MVLAVVDGDPDILQRVPRDSALGYDFAHAFLHGGDELRRDDPAHHRVNELESFAPGQRFDPQEHFSELTRAAGLFLVPVVALRLADNRLAIGDGGQRRLQCNAVLVRHLVESDAHMQFADTAQHRFVHRRDLLEAQGRIFRAQRCYRFVRLLRFDVGFRRDRAPVHGFR